MARKGWQGLSSAYRARLEKAGISRSDYESGQSIQKARGHAETPENPRRYDAGKYKKYDQSRKSLTAQLQAKKEAMWSGKPGWDRQKADQNIRTYPPTMAQLRWALKADEEDLYDAFIETPELYAWFGYH